MQKSLLLNLLLKESELLAIAIGKKNAMANCFFVSLLNLLDENINNNLSKDFDEDMKKELLDAELLLKSYNLDYKYTCVQIVSFLQSQEYNSEISDVTLDSVNEMAEQKAKELNKEIIDTVAFLSAILQNPTSVIETQLGSKKDCADSSESSCKKTADAYTPKQEEVVETKLDLKKFLNVPNQVDDSASSDGISLKDKPDSVEPPRTSDSSSKEEPKVASTNFEVAKEDVPSGAESNKEPKGEVSGIQLLSKAISDSNRIQKFLLENVFGQDQAVNAFVSGYFQSQLMAQSRSEDKKPQATFLFAGPPGVGKTFLAEKVAEVLQLPFARFDMSEYADKEANIEFCGSDHVYKNAKEGNVTGFVEKNPKCVLLFDEIEKAHLNVIHLFLQLLDAGRLRDNYTDKEVSFTNAILIFTTNAGKNLYDDTSITNLSSLPRKKILRALSTDLKPESDAPLFPAAICSRFASGNVVMFNRLGVNNLYTIVNGELNKNVAGFEKSTGIKIKIDKKVVTSIIFAEGGKADARTVKGRANSFYHEELYELFRLLSVDKDVASKIKNIGIRADLDGANSEISKLFINDKTPEVLIFTDKEKLKKSKFKLSKVAYHVTDDIGEAKSIIFNNDLSLILCDVSCKQIKDGKKVLNIEDVESVGIEFLTHALSSYDLPVCLMQYKSGEVSPEEFLSFAKMGVQDIVTICGTNIEKQVLQICDLAYQQGKMIKLAKENKVLFFKTAQTISKNKKSAEITLYNFKLALATDVEDSKNVLDNVQKPNVLFEDVIGAEDAKKELNYFVEYLKNPTKYVRMGVRAPKGVLLYGPPGTGKTLLAKAMAGESDVTFLTAEGNEFLKKYVGEGSQAVHDLFSAARKYAPSIIFIDEIDAIGKNRNSSNANSSADILTALLTEMDGFKVDTSKPVFVLAATNFEIEQGRGARTLDPALVRRFDRRIYIDLPTKEERKRFLRLKVAKNKMISLSEEQIENIAIRSTGSSLADLDSIIEMALRNAICKENCIVDDVAFEEAYETFSNGEKKQWEEDSLQRTARHEAGHALLYWLGGEKPSYITIVARGDHGGYMQHGDSENKGTYTKKELLNRIRTSLAGRATEIVYYGQEDGMSTGASGDLHNATSVAERMICYYGMDEEIGLSYVDKNENSSLYYNEIRKKINEVLSRELQKTIEIVSKNKEAIDALVTALLEKDHLKENEIADIFNSVTLIQ